MNPFLVPRSTSLHPINSTLGPTDLNDKRIHIASRFYSILYIYLPLKSVAGNSIKCQCKITVTLDSRKHFSYLLKPLEKELIGNSRKERTSEFNGQKKFYLILKGDFHFRNVTKRTLYKPWKLDVFRGFQFVFLEITSEDKNKTWNHDVTTRLHLIFLNVLQHQEVIVKHRSYAAKICGTRMKHIVCITDK